MSFGRPVGFINAKPDFEGFRKEFSVRRQVSIYHTSEQSLVGVLLGAGVLTSEGTESALNDGDGYYGNYISGVMNPGDAGIFCTEVVFRETNFDITIKFRINDLLARRSWIGFFTADPLAGDNPITEHIGVRVSSTATNVNFVLSHAGGVTQAETQLGLVDTLIHTIRIRSDEQNSQFFYSWDNGPEIAVTTNIPAASTLLDVFIETLDTLAAGGIGMDIWYLDGFADQ